MTEMEMCREKIEKDCDILRHKHAAIAFSRGGMVIASAVNRRTTGGHISDYSLHAEEFLIKKLRKIRAKERFGYIRILVVRMPKAQEWGMSKPCDGCQRMIKAYGINEVTYTSESGSLVNM
jgi:deoxycytidylate deaminase